MIEELDLFTQKTEEPEIRCMTIQDKFEAFHEKNPHVYANLVKLARQLHEKGHDVIGIGMLFEVLRWNFMLKTDDPNSVFKLNNNYRSRYARLIMDTEKDLDGIFAGREVKSA